MPLQLSRKVNDFAGKDLLSTLFKNNKNKRQSRAKNKQQMKENPQVLTPSYSLDGLGFH
jgi:hypothetical protein